MAVKHTLFFCLIFWGLVGCNSNNRRSLPSLQLTLAGNDTKPMGGAVFKKMVDHVFDSFSVYQNNQSFDKWYNDDQSEDESENVGQTYFIAAPFLNVYQKEAKQMAAFVRKGNTLFIATDGFSDAFTEIFGVAIEESASYNIVQTSKSLADTLQFGNQLYTFHWMPLVKSIDMVDSTLNSKVISYNQFRQPDGWSVGFGNGRIIVVTNAAAFSNYFLLTGNNTKYALGLLAYTQPLPYYVTWDDFYRRHSNRSGENDSMLSALLAIPAMRWAFWIMMALCLIWVITHLARNQRMIPLIEPNRNSTVEFTQTIAQLYFNKRDNRNIALKMIQYFFDHIRNKFYLPPVQLNETFAKLLAGKTNKQVAQVNALLALISEINLAYSISDETLIQLHKEINSLLIDD